MPRIPRNPAASIRKILRPRRRAEGIPARMARFLPAAILFGALSDCTLLTPAPLPSLSPDWRLVPEATVLGENRQFFLYGRKLDSVTVTAPPSLIVEKGAVSSQGRVLSFHFKVQPLPKDSLAESEREGIREVTVKTVDTSVTFKIKVIDEAHPR
jgi:hypothetical protein